MILNPSFFSLLNHYQQEIERSLRESLSRFGKEGALREACEYALLNGGKRFRPALVLAIGKALDLRSDVMEAALAIEFFHTASLIADDLPCMDNDDQRRQKPSLHKVYGEATALLATYALIAAGYENLYRNRILLKKIPLLEDTADVRCALALENVSINTGVQGATGGQFLDLFPQNVDMDFIREVLHKKTISLFEIAFVLGWVFGGGDLEKLPLLKKAASHFGMAFQMADDIEDEEQDRQKGRLINTAVFLGKERTHQLFLREIEEFEACLQQMEWPANELKELIRMLNLAK